MPDPRMVLITGVVGQWGQRLALRLQAEPGLRVIGVDHRPPPPASDNLEISQLDIRDRLLLDLLQSAAVDTVCHLGLIQGTTSYEEDISGSINLFGACLQAGVRKIVTMSSTQVYGAHPDNPGLLAEEHPLRASRRGSVRSLLENEHFWQNFGRMNGRDIDLTVLRFANIIGPTADTPMTRLLSEPKAPVLLGFNPVMQFIHEADVVAALAHAVLEDAPGTYNIGGGGTVPLIKAMALAGKPPLALPASWVRLGASLLDGQLGQLTPFDFDYLRYRWVADTSKMTEILGFYPRYSGEEAVRAFASGKDEQRWQSVLDQALAQGEELRQFVDQYRRQVEREEMG